MQRVNLFLRSEAATLLLLAMALIAQTPHAAAVFWRLAQTENTYWWILPLLLLHSIAYAIALEFATLIFVVRGQSRLAWTFAGVSVLVNAAYYYDASITPDNMLRAALISIALPASIAFYSHSVARAHGAQVELIVDALQPIEEPLQPDKAPELITEEPLQVALALPCNVEPKVRALQLKSEGLSNGKIASELQVNISTVGRWLKAVQL